MGRIFAALALSATLSACAVQGPIIDTTGPGIDTSGRDLSKYSVDYDQCAAYAQQISVGGTTVNGAVVGSAAGALLGAVAGAFFHQAGYGAAVGASMGAAQGVVGGLATGVSMQANVFRNCMVGRGYRVLN